MESTRKKFERFRYSQEQLEEALARISNKDISLRKASKLYNIPKSTLSNKLNNKVPLQRKMGPSTQLSLSEEKMLADWILAKAKVGFPMHPEEVYDTVEMFLKQNKRENKFANDRPGRKWLELFLNRHPEITKRNAEILSKARAAVTEEAIRNWFTELNNFLEEENALDIKSDPSRIFNSDETGVMTCLKSGLILGPKNYKNTYEIASGKEKESITVLCTFSADGNDVPPFVLYPYKRMPPAVVQNFPDTWYIGRSDSGWMVSAVFFTYIKLFYEWLVKNDIKLPVLLFLDGHKSHINRDMFEFCREKGIMIFCLYPNSTHILQPCDVGIFGPLKKSWKVVVRKHKQASTVPITKQNFAAMFKTAYDRSIKSTTIKNSFRACGLYPISPDAVDYSRCINNRTQEISRQTQFNNTTSSLLDHSQDLRCTIKVIEGEVGPLIKKEFTISYNVNSSHSHPYFELWKKCRGQLEHKKQNDMITPDTSNVPLDLSVSSQEASMSILNENDSILQTLEGNHRIPETTETKIVNEEMDTTASSIVIDPTITLPLNSSMLFGATSVSPTCLPFDTTEDLVDFIVENEINIPAVIPLPWYNTTEEIIESNCIIDSCFPNSCPSPQTTLPPIAVIPSCSNNTIEGVSLKSTIDTQTEIVSIINSTNSVHSSNESKSQPLDMFLKIPDLPQKKFKINKKLPAPYGLTGLKYKEYLKKQDDEKKIKEEELANKRKKREEKRLNKEKSQKNSSVQQKRPKNCTKKSVKKVKHDDPTHEQPSGDVIPEYLDIIIKDNEETEIRTKKTSTICTEFKDNLFGKYVVVQFESGKRMRHFVGEVIMINDEENKFKVNFLRKKSVVESVVNFAKPIVPDIAEVDFADIKRVLDKPIVSRRGLISFDDLEFKDIE